MASLRLVVNRLRRCEVRSLKDPHWSRDGGQEPSRWRLWLDAPSYDEVYRFLKRLVRHCSGQSPKLSLIQAPSSKARPNKANKIL
jgi:hypothetical protein